jgi:putative peptidoglycan lipid II flippase
MLWPFNIGSGVKKVRGTKKAAKSAAIIAIFTLISKFLGFIREMIVASKFGSGWETDTYVVSMTATVIIMSIVGDALDTTLIPIFSEIEGKMGRKEKLKYMNNVVNVIFFITIILAVVGYFLSPLTISILAKGFKGEQFDLAVKLNRIGVPIIIFLGLNYVYSGFLQSDEKFFAPAANGIPFNIIYIIFLFLFSYKFGMEGLMATGIIAIFVQWLVLVPSTKRSGYKWSFQFDLKDKYLYKSIILTIPVLIGSSIDQINTIVNKTLASSLRAGSISALNYASRVSDIFVSAFAVAIATAVFPMLSNAFNNGKMKEVKEIMAEGINIIIIITVPSTIGIIIFAQPAVKLFFQRGAFGERATLMTSQALVCYSFGLLGLSLRTMATRVYYSLQDMITPMINGMVSVGLNIILNLILIKYMAHSGLALSASISATVTSILLFFQLRRKIGRIGLTRYFTCFVKVFLASVIMGVASWGIYSGLGKFVSDTTMSQFLRLFLSVGMAIIVYMILCTVLKVSEMKTLINRLKNR